MSPLVRDWRILLLAGLLVLSLGSILFNGIEFGVDFRGGTVFQIELEESVSPERMAIITSVIGERLDAFGLQDTKVTSLGDNFVSAQLAETNPERIEHLESLLKTQGKFEAMLEGEVLFEGEDIRQVFKDPAQGYGITSSSARGSSAPAEWQLPFLLSQEGAEKFSRGVFHRCTAVSFSQQGGSVYDCVNTYFFIDRPSDSVLIVPESVFSNDSRLLASGNVLENIPAGTDAEALLENADIPYFVLSGNAFAESQLEELSSLAAETGSAVVHPTVNSSQRELLEGVGYSLTEVPEKDSGIPWIWTATGARQVISVTPGIANLEPFVPDIRNARVFSQLVITGSAPNDEEAFRELKALEIVLETGSLPIGIKDISKETISPLLGEEFLSNTLFIGLVGLVVVAAIIFVRYRIPKLVVPIMVTALSEIVIILGFVSLVRFNLDLAAVAGVLAAVGTGVDHQIIITDELLKGEVVTRDTLLNRAKKAFFIISATALTNIATMLPIIFFSFGLGKLRGFALIVIIGVLAGILVTRPAFSVIAQHVLRQENPES